MTKIVTRYQAENEPARSQRSLQRAADLGFSDARIITDGHFHDTKFLHRALQDDLDRPAVSGFFQVKLAKHFQAAGAERPEVRDPYAIKMRNQKSRKMIAEGSMPRHCAR